MHANTHCMQHEYAPYCAKFDNPPITKAQKLTLYNIVAFLYNICTCGLCIIILPAFDVSFGGSNRDDINIHAAAGGIMGVTVALVTEVLVETAQSYNKEKRTSNLIKLHKCLLLIKGTNLRLI